MSSLVKRRYDVNVYDCISPLLGYEGHFGCGYITLIATLVLAELESSLPLLKGIDRLEVLQAVLKIKQNAEPAFPDKEIKELRHEIAQLKNKYRAKIRAEKKRIIDAFKDDSFYGYA